MSDFEFPDGVRSARNCVVRVECEVMAVRPPFEMGNDHRRLSATLHRERLGPGAPERPLVRMLLQYWLLSACTFLRPKDRPVLGRFTLQCSTDGALVEAASQKESFAS